MPAITVLLLVFVIVLGVNVRRLQRAKRQQGLGKPWFISRVDVEMLDPVFRMDALGPTRATEVRYIGRGVMEKSAVEYM